MADEKLGEAIPVRFAGGLFDIEAIKRAAYHLSDRAVVEIEPSDDGVDCFIRPLASEQDSAALVAAFRNHVLDYDLRIRIGKETEPMRNLVLALAFSKTGLQG
jgi:His-Xaa-Ser system protein HxsD